MAKSTQRIFQTAFKVMTLDRNFFHWPSLFFSFLKRTHFNLPGTECSKTKILL